MHKAPQTVSCPLLIGRDEVLELADRRIDEVIAERGQFLLLAGQAGIGKTRLLGAIRRQAEARGFVTVAGAVAPQDHDVPAASILDLARTMTRVASLADLGRELLELGDAALDAEHARRRRLVTGLVERILDSLPGPTMLAFEDLQWADDVSLEIVADLARRSRDRSLLLVGDYRTEDVLPGASLRDWRARLITQRIAEEIRLTPLTQAETALATTLILDTGLPAPRDVVAAVYDRTDGIPLHIEELLGAMSAEARADGTAIRQATVPDTIEDAVITRIAQLSPEAQATARAGAVIGRCFVPEVLEGIMDAPPGSLEESLRELVDNAVLDPPGGRGLYDFRHQLLRDVLYRTIPASERRRFHARAGEFGAQLEGASEIHASVHYERAGLPRQAFDAALAGAREAARLSAHREAFELYRRAVDNMPDDIELADRATILAAYADEALAIEENEIAERTAHEADVAYRSLHMPAQAIGALEIAMSVWRREGRPLTERLAVLRELRTELEALPEEHEVLTARADIGWYLAVTLIDARALTEARSILSSVRAIADRVEDPELELITAWKEGYADAVGESVERGSAIVGQVAMTAERRGWESAGVSAFRDAAVLAANALDYGGAARWIGEGLRYADSIEQSYCAHVMSSTAAMVSWAGSDLVDAQARARQAIADKGCRRGAAMARWALGYVAMASGDLGMATMELDAALQFGLTSEEIELILPPLWGLAEVASLAGEYDRAMAMCQEAMLRAQAVGERTLLTPFVVTGVRAAQQAGRPAEAATWFDACAAHLAAMPDVAGAALDHARGLVALADGATGVARLALESAVVGWDRHGRAWEAAWARLDLAQCLVRSNRFADAITHALVARTAAGRLDSVVLVDRADGLLRMARSHATDDEPWRPLTAREFEVARLIGEGQTNAEIAETLGIATKTASSHVEHILAKLGAARRAEIATWASHVHTASSRAAGPPLEPAARG